jgi:hypothetical protein
MASIELRICTPLYVGAPPPPPQQWATERPSMQGRSSEFLLLLTDHHPPITDRIIGASSLPLLLATTLWMDANYQCASSFKKILSGM